MKRDKHKAFPFVPRCSRVDAKLPLKIQTNATRDSFDGKCVEMKRGRVWNIYESACDYLNSKSEFSSLFRDLAELLLG